MSTKKRSKKKKISISKKSPYEWTVDEVVLWLESKKYLNESKQFKSASINGSKLFSLDRTILQNDIKIFDAKARNAILNEISKLKKQIKEIQKNRVEKFASKHVRKEKEEKQSIQIPDDMKKRTYVYIKTKANRKSNDATINNIESILNHYQFANEKHHQLIEENQNQSELHYYNKCMFIIMNAKLESYQYLFTKNVEEWSINNVFDYMRHVSNHQFILFADELKRKKVDGPKLLKYTRQKLQNDYGNFFDSTLRKKALDEIKLLKKEIVDDNDAKTASDEKKAKRYHATHQRTKSEIERDRQKRQKMRKAGPRDVGKIKYKGSVYDDSKDKQFLEDTIHPLSKDEKFQKRKEKNPVSKKKTVDEIGKNKYDGMKYDGSNDASFLDDRMNPLSKEERFQKRKELNPISKKQTVTEIGTNKYDGMKYDGSNDASFLDDRMHPLSKDERFQKRKELNPISKKETVTEIGKLKYDGIKYDATNDASFLEDRMHPLSKDERFQKRKELNPVSKKETVKQIGKADDFKGPDWKLEDVVDSDKFLSDNAYYRTRTAMITDADATVEHKPGAIEVGTVHGFKKPEWSEKVDKELASNNNDWMNEKVKKEDKDYQQLATQIHKEGAVEVGKIHGFDAIDYELTAEEMIGGFLDEKLWHESSKVHQGFEAISRLLRSLPANKLHVMYSIPLPTGFNTKIVWLKKLRDIVETECKNEEDEKESKLRKKQLSELDALLKTLHVEVPKPKEK